MSKIRLLIILFAISLCPYALAGPKHSITKIVGRNTISDDDVNKIEQYAIGWAEDLLTTNAVQLREAQRKLIEPLEPAISMSPYARSLYGKALKDGFAKILDADNSNEMSAVNALQIVSLLGTEQGCGILLNHADTSTESRVALRHWASVGLGKSFKLGILPDRRISSIATLLADFASREPVWHVIARQFDSLAILQGIPNLDSRQQDEIESLSLELQTRALQELVLEISKNKEADNRVKALPFILSSIRLQLVEPGLNKEAREQADQEIVPSLILLTDTAIKHAMSAKDNDDLHQAYGEAIQSASFIVDRILKAESKSPSTIELWTSHSLSEITSRLNAWRNLQ